MRASAYLEELPLPLIVPLLPPDEVLRSLSPPILGALLGELLLLEPVGLRMLPEELLLVPEALYSGIALSSSRESAVWSFASSPVPLILSWLKGTDTSWEPIPRNPPTDTITLLPSIFSTVPILSPCAFVTALPTTKPGGVLAEALPCSAPEVEPGVDDELLDDELMDDEPLEEPADEPIGCVLAGPGAFWVELAGADSGVLPEE
jgi:hypothetical protein